MDIEQNDQIHTLRTIQLLESNCQYLTVIKHQMYRRSIGCEKTLKLYQGEFEEGNVGRLNYEAFIQLFIESMYFIFSCKYHGVKLKINHDDIRIQEQYLKPTEKKQKIFTIYMYYSFGDESTNFHEVSFIDNLFLFLIQFYAEYDKNGYFSASEHKKYIENFIKEYGYINTNIGYFQNERQREFFLCLEETELFRTFSHLVRIKNSSILDYLKPMIELFKQAKKRDIQLTNEYTNEYHSDKKKIPGDLQERKKKESAIQDNIIKFFKQIAQDGYEFREETDQYKVKFTYKIKPKQQKSFKERIAMITPKLPTYEATQMQDSINAEEQESQMNLGQYYIEYNSEKNSIYVRLAFNCYNVNIQTSDYLMYVSSILSFDSANISIEVVDSKEEKPHQAPTKKYLVFKGSSCFNTKQPALEKILTLMDLTLISSRIAQPELNPYRVYFFNLQHYNRFTELSKKINHYTKIYLKCSKKVYQLMI